MTKNNPAATSPQHNPREREMEFHRNFRFDRSVIGWENGDRINSAKEFREYADERMGSAKIAKSVKERRTLLQMTEAWLQVADQWDITQLRRPAHSAFHMLERSK